MYLSFKLISILFHILEIPVSNLNYTLNGLPHSQIPEYLKLPHDRLLSYSFDSLFIDHTIIRHYIV
jgi:hypothetical protein